jgi:hypothetical protein
MKTNHPDLSDHDAPQRVAAFIAFCPCTPLVFLLSVVLTGILIPASSSAQSTLTNGWMHTGTIGAIGASNVWTFSASVGDAILLEAGEISQTNNFTPRIRLINPSGNQQGVNFGAVAAQISVIATNSGTFTVVVDDVNGTVATGTYRLTLAKTPGAVFVAPGDDGGPMTNGVMHTGTIDVGDLDVWTFNATNGDTMIIEAGEVNPGSALTPALWLYGPDGKLLDSGYGAVAIQVGFRATNSGAFTLVVGDYSTGYSGSGPYRLTLAKTGDPIALSPGDDGGPMTNAVMHTGTIDVGDLDVWNFTATNGDTMMIEAGEINPGSALTPALWLYGPDGKLLDSGYGAAATQVSFRATNSGAFTLVVGDYSTGYSGSGPYRLTLAKTGDPIVLSPGDDGGPMTNAVMHAGTIDVGDLDVWNFAASNGDTMMIEVGETNSGSALTPAVWLYGPDGKLLGSGYGAAAALVTFRATNSGTFTLVVGDYSNGYSGSGPYRLTLAKTGASIVVSPGDDGGPLTNGWMHTGTIVVGDLDVWQFTATSGDTMILEAGEINAGSALTPAIWFYGPDGKLLDSGYGAAANQVGFRATNSGTFTVVVGDYSSGYSGSGPYRLTLAKTGAPITIAPGDEGGIFNGAGLYNGTIDVGDLDIWMFTACAGDAISIRMDEATTGLPLTPRLLLYGRDGVLVSSPYGAATAQLNVVAAAGGVYTIVAGDYSAGFTGSGAYTLTVNGLTGGLKFCDPTVAGTTTHLTGVGGVPGQSFVVLTHTNITAPLDLWQPIGTNQFDGFGAMSFTNFFSPAEPKRFFLLEKP